MSDFSFIPPTSVVTIPGANASAAFTAKTSEVFKEEHNIAPIIINDRMKYIPWGGDNQMPYNIIDLIESDETMSTCQMFNAEVCYGSGLVYDAELATAQVKSQVDDFMLDNDLASYFLGVCQDFKHFGFCVSVIILNEDASRIVRIVRKQACYVRFAPADKSGVIPYILYANWRNTVSPENIERIELLNPQAPFTDLQSRSKKIKKFAVVCRIPTPDNTYYPIPYYAALFKGKWYDIKQLIGVAKEAKLRNSAPIKYHIEIANSFWNNIFKVEGITDRVKQQERVCQEKDNIINFLTGMENSGKVLFSTFYVSPNGEEQHDVVINKIETDNEGWRLGDRHHRGGNYDVLHDASPLQPCRLGAGQVADQQFRLRQTRALHHRPGSAKALPRPSFSVHRLIIRFNKWTAVKPDCPFIQLTTLDENKDAKQVSLNKSKNNGNADK